MWADHGRELCWCNGVTIAFHEEISAVLDRLVDQNFPDFSTIALSLGTLRNSWPEVAAQLTHAVSVLMLSPNPLIRQAADLRKNLLQAWPDSLRKLSLMARYVEVYSPTTSQRAELIAHLLGEFSSNFAESTQEELASAVRAGLPEDWLKDKSDERHSDVDLLLLPMSLGEALRISASREVTEFAVPRMLRLFRIAKSVAASIPCETVEQLHELLKTGIPDGIKVPEYELLDQRTQTRGLLEQLSEDDELGGFARLTKQLIAAITLPRSLSEPDNLQMGGISDITNRGSLDKLLLSELAHDNLTLAVRLAMNEALYMRRESPPSPQTITRSVLIDLSLPMWGIPRLYATAAAMALHVTSGKQIRINCFRSSVSGMKATLLTTRDSLHDHMTVLEPTEHPGASLPSFFQTIADEPLSAEPVLITTSDVLESLEFRQTLDKTCTSDLWLIVVERDGRLKVLQRTRQGTSLHKQLQLPLEEILSRRSAEKVRRTDLPDDLPAVFHLSRFPLLLSHQTRIDRLWKWGETAIAVTDDGRLMHWTEKGLGARQLAAGLVGRSDAKIFLVQRPTGLFLQLLICPMSDQVGTLLTVSGTHGEVSVAKADYRIPMVTDIVVTEPALLVFGKTHERMEVCSAIEHDEGTFLGTHILNEVLIRNGRCLSSRGQAMSVLNWVGGQYSWLLQRLPDWCEQYVSVAEQNIGDYIAIDEAGQLIDPQNPKRFRALNEELRSKYDVGLLSFREVSIDGDLAVVSHNSLVDAAGNRGSGKTIIRTSTLKRPSGHTTIDLQSATVIASSQNESANGELARIEYERASKLIRQHTPHYRFARIGTDSGRLLLKDSNGGLFHVAWDSHISAIKLGPVVLDGALQGLIEFVDSPPVPGTGYTLQTATWDNGSMAWLDSRGLIHLKSGNRANPEITLVMRDGPLSGWLSSGEVFGDNYYCGKNPVSHGLRRVTADSAWNSAIRPFIESVPWNFHFSSDTAQAGNTVLPEY